MANQVEALLKAIADSQKDILKAAQKTADILKDVLAALAKSVGSVGGSALAGAAGGAIAAHGGRAQLTAYAASQGRFGAGTRATASAAQSVTIYRRGKPPITTNSSSGGFGQAQASGAFQNSSSAQMTTPEPQAGPAAKPDRRPGFLSRSNRWLGGTLATAGAIAISQSIGSSRSGDNYAMWQAGMDEGHGRHGVVQAMNMVGMWGFGDNVVNGLEQGWGAVRRGFNRGINGIGDLLGIR